MRRRKRTHSRLPELAPAQIAASHSRRKSAFIREAHRDVERRILRANHRRGLPPAIRPGALSLLLPARARTAWEVLPRVSRSRPHRSDWLQLTQESAGRNGHECLPEKMGKVRALAAHAVKRALIPKGIAAVSVAAIGVLPMAFGQRHHGSRV